MSFIKDLNYYKSILSPGKYSSKNFDVGSALSLYYKLSIIPILLSFLVGLLVAHAYPSATHAFVPLFTMFSIFAGASIAVIASTLIVLWAIVPIGIFINAFIYHMFGKYFLKTFKFKYGKTFAGATFGIFPLLFLYWLLFVPKLSIVVLPIIGVWEFVVLVIAVSSQQKISRLQSFGVLVASELIILMFIFTMFMIGFASLLPAALSSTHGVASGATIGSATSYP